jgi:hypothetical protein
MQIVLLIVTALTSLVRPAPATAEPAACISRLLRDETSTRRASLPAPLIAPTTGEGGTQIEVRGSGVEQGARIEIVAVYGDAQCTIVGLGDQHLGTTKADRAGRYLLRRPWPDTFRPWQGRGGSDPVPLPAGRYFILAIPCAAETRCSFTDGTLPGGPFIQGTPDRTGTGPARGSRGRVIGVTAAALAALTFGVITANRRRRTIRRT